MRIKLVFIFWTMCSSFILTGQMEIGGELLYGHEWIDYEKDYFKIKVAEDGIYRISYPELVNAGIPADQIQGKEFQLFHFGQEVLIRVSTEGNLSGSDFIEFYGRRNRGEIDRFIYEDADVRQLNPEYSLFNDTSSYYLSWDISGAGRRYAIVDNRTTGELPIVESFYMHEESQVFSSFHLKPTRNGVDRIRYSSLDVSEGFGSPLSRTHNLAFQTSSVFQEGPAPTVYVRFGGNSVSHRAEFRLDDRVLGTRSYFDYEVNEFDEMLSVSDIDPTTEFELYGATSSNDRFTVAHALLTYPREFRFSDQSHFIFHVEPELANKYFEISDFDLDGANPWLYDVTNGYALETAVVDDSIKFLLPSSDVKRTLVLVNPVGGVKTVADIQPSSFVNYFNREAEFIILTNSALRSGSGTTTDWVEAYAEYRGSEEGGGFKTAIVDIEQLYDQFAFGIDRHPIAVRNFAQYLSQTWQNPQFLFIIGKAREYPLIRTKADISHPRNKTFFVPTFGSPGSDNVLISGLGETVPLLPVGRLAAQSPEDIRVYLDKVKLHENPIANDQTIEDQLWKKKILHLSGGDAVIQEVIFSYLNDMAETIETSKFGADVTTFRKTSADPIQIATSQRIIRTIDEGVSFITFFGHSAVGTFDFSLEEPSKYSNFGKYPMIISLGCHSGNIHSEAIGISEDFVIENGKGAIAFLASSGSAYISPQYVSGKDYYDFTGEQYIGLSIGQILRQTIQSRGDDKNITVRTLNEQLTLHGDPAVSIEPGSGPDFTFDFSDVKTTPSIISTNRDSFEFEFNLVNLGQSVPDSLDILIQHVLPEGEITLERTLRIRAPFYSTKIIMTLPVPGLKSIGKNTVLVSIDVKDEIAEMPLPVAELNNDLKNFSGEAGYCFYILDNSARPVYPPEFSIVSESNIQLKASTSNAFLEAQPYIFEIDTSELFNSSLLERNSQVRQGGVISWNPGIDLVPERVYYWRSSPDSNITNTGYLWENSSFVYLPDESEGWNQSHYYQILKDDFDGLDLPANRHLQYDTAGFFISIHNKIFEPITPPGFQFNFETFAASVRPWDFMTEGIAIAVTDAITGNGWINNGGDYGSIATGSFSSYRVFGFRTDTPENRKAIMDFIEDVVPDGNHVYIWTVLKTAESDFYPGQWEGDTQLYGKNLFTVLEAEGASMVSQLKTSGSVPYNFIYIKGQEKLGEDIALTKDGFIKTDAFIPVLGTDGKLSSTVIGPAKSWSRVLWEATDLESQDEISLDIYAINSQGMENPLEMTLTSGDYDLSTLDAGAFPFIRLHFNSMDTVQRTSPHLDFWRVLYEELPDAAISPENHLSFHADSLQQGEELVLEVGIENLTNTGMDSLLIKYSLVDAQNNEQTHFRRIHPLPGRGTIQLNIVEQTSELAGNYQLLLEINPEQDQPEKHSFNNFGIKEFYVFKDDKTPILDVTFDGIHIMDGDLVAVRPLILIELNDDNPFLPIDDISFFDVTVIRPDGTEWEVQPTDPALVFIPAVKGEDNRAKLEFSPELSEGDYKLIVQARDASGNFSGENAYEINFRVIAGNGISQVLNYPNPFSTSTQFIFTLTGEVPQVLTIRIMTLSGKVVREITKEELGNLHIGINRTEYKWDGKDDYGSPLANGIYLYRVFAKSGASEDYTPIITSMDSFFEQDMGKLVIMR